MKPQRIYSVIPVQDMKNLIKEIRERELNCKKAYHEDRAAFTDGVQTALDVLIKKKEALVFTSEELREKMDNAKLDLLKSIWAKIFHEPSAEIIRLEMAKISRQDLKSK